MGLFERIERADLALARRATSHRHPTADAALPLLSIAANKARLWMAVAAVLGLMGARRQRRAAQRGMLALAGASVLTNALFKPLLPRPRPSQPEVRLFPRVRLPTSSSFPSGHAASAAAFATAAAMESPGVAAPVAALAAAVAYSRVSTGVHYPSDVVVGGAIGVGVALSTARVWPLIDSNPAKATVAAPLRQLEAAPAPDGAGLHVVVNAAAGPGAHDQLLAQLREELREAKIIEVTDPASIEVALERAAASATTLGVVGGDGTVNTAARVALAHDRALAIFPGGTLNHFARDLGVDEVAQAIDAIRLGHLVEVDTSLIDGHLFMNTASFGSYSEFVRSRQNLEGRMGKWPAAAVALEQALRKGKRFEMRLDGEPLKVWMMFIGNCEYDPPGFTPATRERLDDGMLDIRFVDGSSPAARLRLAIAVLTGSVARSGVYTRRVVPRVEISTDAETTVLAADGEIFDGSGSFTVEKSARDRCASTPRGTEVRRELTRTFLGALCALAVGLACWAIASIPAVRWLDERSSRWLHSLAVESELIADLASVVTHLGDPVVLALIAGTAAVVAFRRGSRRGAWAIVVVGGTVAVVESGLKLVIARSRPEVDSMLIESRGFSFPSGHAANTAAVLGAVALALAAGTSRHRATVAATVGALLVGLSRPVLGVHFVADVMTGWLVALVVLSITRPDRWAGRRYCPLDTRRHL